MLFAACRPRSSSVTLYTTRTPILPDGGGGTRIVLAWIPFKNAKSPHTILYSHPNALDLGHCIPYCMDLGRLLGVNVLTYDYTGYGCSEGLPSVRHSRADITAAYQFLENRMDMSEKNIVLVRPMLESMSICVSFCCSAISSLIHACSASSNLTPGIQIATEWQCHAD
jgi:hypothetical protein